MNKLEKGYLFFIAATFLLCGIYGFVDPVGMVALLDITINSDTAKTEILAMYGGLLFGLGCVIGYCAFSQVRLGLLISVLTLGGIGLGRLCGIWTGQNVGVIHSQLCAIELSCALVAIVLLSVRSA